MRIGIDCRKAADFGIGTYIRGLTHALADLPGDERYVLFARASSRHLLPSDERFEIVEEDSPHYSVRELFAVGRQIRRKRLNLFHAPHYVVPVTDVATVVTIHDLIHLNQPRSGMLERPYASWMISRAVHSSRTVLTVSSAVAAQISNRFPPAGKKIVVTPNGVGAAFTAALEPSDETTLSRLGLSPGSYLLFVGNDKPHKNLPRLLEAFDTVRSALPDIGLVVAGSTPAAAQGRAGVSVTGFISDSELAALYRGALLLVQPSLEEGFGLPVLEAMASGTPALVSKTDALTEVGGDAVETFDATSSEAMARSITEIASDAGRRSAMIARGISRAALFTWKCCAEKTLEVYRASADVVR